MVGCTGTCSTGTYSRFHLHVVDVSFTLATATTTNTTEKSKDQTSRVPVRITLDTVGGRGVVEGKLQQVLAEEGVYLVFYLRYYR